MRVQSVRRKESQPVDKQGEIMLTPRFQLTTAIVASLLLMIGTAVAEPVPNGRLLASQCFQCHNAKGVSTGFDSITGESVSEIYNELREMRAKATTEKEIMHSQAAIYTDAEMMEIAKYLSTLPKGLND